MNNLDRNILLTILILVIVVVLIVNGTIPTVAQTIIDSFLFASGS